MSTAERIEVFQVDLSDPEATAALVDLLNEYSCSLFGSGQPLSDGVLNSLVEGLIQTEGYRGWIAYLGDEPVGLLNAFLGFSTFKAQKLLNVHDVTVRSTARRRGVAKQMLQTAIGWARENDCCRVTLEVRSDNQNAKDLYHSLGFSANAPEGVNYEFLTLGLS